jgi:hypothetical protein
VKLLRQIGLSEESHDVGAQSSPIVWTRSNIVLSAHPTRPSIHGQIISGTPNSPSAHHFDLPPPDPVGSNPELFGPPTCLIISNNDTHLFAFFPPSHLNIPHASALKLEGGVSCVWERTNEITSWGVLEFWRSERGNDVVAGQWLDNNRKVSVLTPNKCHTNYAYSGLSLGPQSPQGQSI